ncbi:hypothetical protein H2200_010751 [Cladophialophora chaetospira]|uniref:Myb-like DNA-binding domain-containing protein n=1 Tax=Cladophialophora chaetospira TaxID=386627 RepID=A0AA38X0U3_9EURO|nr:hypothetical protein H2200_010751 [Cladophialophora chaetospira]
MSRATSDDQLRFLLSCVKHSTNGRVDFVEVAKECGVVSKGAAAKRYERLLKANGISSSTPHAATAAMTSVAAQKSTKKTKEPGAKKRKLERDESPAEGEEKKLKLSTNAVEEAAGSNAMKSEAVNGVPQPAIAGGLPLGPGAPAMYMTRNAAPMAHGLPSYAMQPRLGFAGYPPYGHQLAQDMPIYPPFAPTNFREPWTTPMAYHDDGFQEYINQDAYHQHLQLEPLPARIPPPPQEVVFMKPEERQSEEEEEPLRSGEGVVVVE